MKYDIISENENTTTIITNLFEYVKYHLCEINPNIPNSLTISERKYTKEMIFV